MKVTWTPEAQARLREIHAFVAERNPGAATELMARLVARAESLQSLSDRGRRVPEFPGSDLRELVDGNYRIVYRVRRPFVQVLTVFEAHRLLREGEVL